MCGECKCLRKRRYVDPWEQRFGRLSYLKGISGWKYHPEVSADHTIWHLQNEMLYLRSPWKPLFLTNPHFKIRFFFLLSATEQIALSLVITSHFFLHISQTVECHITSFLTAALKRLLTYPYTANDIHSSLLPLYLLYYYGLLPL